MVRVVGDAGVFGGLGSVLGEVAGDLFGRQVPVGIVDTSGGPHWSGVELASERKGPGRVVGVDAGFGQPHGPGRGADQVGQLVGGDGCGGGCEPVDGAGAVEADQGVEVDHAAQLVLGDLGVLHRGDLAQSDGRHGEGPGDQAAQGDGEPAPQVRCPPLPHHVRGVVVAVPAEWLPQPWVVLGMGDVAGGWPAVRASRSAPRVGVAAPALVAAAVHRAPNEGAVRVANTSGFSATDSGTVLPPTTPARIRWSMSAAYSREHDGHSPARRLPQRTCVTPSGSWLAL
jgi:hypothetical protein